MATTRRYSIKTAAGPSLAYIKNGEKSMFTSGINCSVEFAKEEFEDVSRGTVGKVKAYHTIQSFSPDDNVTPEMAHEIGVRLAREVYGDYQCVVATHTDKGHIHNHIISNSTSFKDRSKMKDKLFNLTSLNEIRRVSDRLCAEYGLSVLPEHKIGRFPHMHVSTLKNRPYREMRMELTGAVRRLVPVCRNASELKKALENEGFKFDKNKVTYNTFKRTHYYPVKTVIGKELNDYYEPPKNKKQVNSGFVKRMLDKIKKPRIVSKVKAYIGHFLEYTSGRIHDFKAEAAISDKQDMTRNEMNSEKNTILDRMREIDSLRKHYEKLLEERKKYLKYKRYYDGYNNEPLLLNRNGIEITRFEEAFNSLKKEGYEGEKQVKGIRNEYLALNREYNRLENRSDYLSEKIYARDMAKSYECGEFRVIKAKPVGFRGTHPIVPVSDRFMEADRFVRAGKVYFVPIEENKEYIIEKEGKSPIKMKGYELFDYLYKDDLGLSREMDFEKYKS